MRSDVLGAEQFIDHDGGPDERINIVDYSR
jgi:hypothetical protein